MAGPGRKVRESTAARGGVPRRSVAVKALGHRFHMQYRAAPTVWRIRRHPEVVPATGLIAHSPLRSGSLQTFATVGLGDRHQQALAAQAVSSATAGFSATVG